MLAESGPSVLDRLSAVLAEACRQALWAQSDADVLGRVAEALRVRAQADAVLLAAVAEVESRGLARTRGASSTRAWLTGAHRSTRPKPGCWSGPAGRCGRATN